MGELIKEIPEYLRPYEKAEKNGVISLDDAELLALFLRSGTGGEGVLQLSRRVIQKAGGRISGIRNLSFQDLRSLKGIGKVKAVQLLALSVLASRINNSFEAEKTPLTSADIVAESFGSDLALYDQEAVKILYLDGKCHLIRQMIISIGTVNQTMVPIREILINALNARAVFMIMMHNHPSGDPEPSEADLVSTGNLLSAGRLIGIHLLDHIIIGNHKYVSLKERGLFSAT